MLQPDTNRKGYMSWVVSALVVDPIGVSEGPKYPGKVARYGVSWSE